MKGSEKEDAKVAKGARLGSPWATRRTLPGYRSCRSLKPAASAPAAVITIGELLARWPLLTRLAVFLVGEVEPPFGLGQISSGAVTGLADPLLRVHLPYLYGTVL
jgi:hypothetical protein